MVGAHQNLNGSRDDLSFEG